jgi:uncharacterized protein
MEPNNRMSVNYQDESKFDLKKHWIVFPILLVLMVLWQWVTSPMIITVIGTGEVNVPATNATVTFAVLSNDQTAQGAISSVQTNAEGIKSFLKTKGVTEADIATSQVTASPLSLTTVGGTGFQASITMSAKTIHVADVGDLVSSLYSNGATAVSQPVLSVENEESLDMQAYNSAMKDANKKASGIALKNWKLIKKIINVASQSSGTTSTATSTADTLTQAHDSVAAQNGVFKIVEAVSVSYKMW